MPPPLPTPEPPQQQRKRLIWVLSIAVVFGVLVVSFLTYRSFRAGRPQSGRIASIEQPASEQPASEQPPPVDAPPDKKEGPPQTTPPIPPPVGSAAPPEPAVEPPKVSTPSSASSRTPSRFARYGNIEAPDQAPIQTEFSIHVSLTREKLSDETLLTGVGPGVNSTPDGAIDFPCPEPCTITAVLFAPGFDVVSGSNQAAIRLAADRDAPPARFTLKSHKGLTAARTAITADFWNGKTFIAKVSRTISIGRSAPPVQPTATPPTNIPVPYEARESADLTVRWEEKDVNGLHFCSATVYSPAFRGLRSEDCVPGDQIQKFLDRRYGGVLKSPLRTMKPLAQGVTPPSPDQVISQMRGLGRELFEQFAPRNFKAAIQQMRATLTPLRTIQIETNNPALPWELMVPCGDADCGFLGIDYQVARWHISDRAPDLAPQIIHYASLEALAPHYSGSSYLPNQQRELQALSTMPGFQTAGGKVNDFRQAFESPGGSILHFAGHGQSGQSDQLSMEDAAADPTMLRGWRRGADARLYFWNACDSGQETTVASFVDGWAPALLDNGAGGFIGGMWPLGDAAAADFAQLFYTALKNGLGNPSGAQVANLVQLGRARFKSTGDPTYLAYVFYGDVTLRIRK